MLYIFLQPIHHQFVPYKNDISRLNSDTLCSLLWDFWDFKHYAQCSMLVQKCTKYSSKFSLWSDISFLMCAFWWFIYLVNCVTNLIKIAHFYPKIEHCALCTFTLSFSCSSATVVMKKKTGRKTKNSKNINKTEKKCVLIFL